jgi:integrase/recombinase XerD
MRLQAAVEAYFLAKDFTPSATRWYQQKLSAFATWCEHHEAADIELVTAPLVRRYIAEVRVALNPRTGTPMTSNTLHGYVRAIKGFLNWCAREDLISEKVPSRLEMPKREQKVIATFSKDDIQRLLAAASHGLPQYPWFAERDKAILMLLLDTGIRANELCDLTLDRVRISTDDAYIIVNGKGRKQREVGLGQRSRTQLHRYIHRFRPQTLGELHVFLTRDHKPLHPEGLDRLLYRLRDETGIEGVRVSAHTFRHTFACAYLMDGGDIYRLSRLLGHTSVVVTEMYLRAFNSRDARRDRRSVLDSLAR